MRVQRHQSENVTISAIFSLQNVAGSASYILEIYSCTVIYHLKTVPWQKHSLSPLLTGLLPPSSSSSSGSSSPSFHQHKPPCAGPSEPQHKPEHKINIWLVGGHRWNFTEILNSSHILFCQVLQEAAGILQPILWYTCPQ